MSRSASASYLLLFDRIAGLDEREPEGDLIDGAGLRRSIERELGRLFNTTSRLTIAQFLKADLTVLDYGLPDFRGLAFDSSEVLSELAIVFERAIQAFEPRMRQTVVKVSSSAEMRAGVTVDVIATVIIGAQQKRVQFGLEIAPDAALTLTSS
jgi:type VI secretion system protein ImpF